MRETIKHVFFDLDNTLWDHRANSEITLRQMFKDYAVEENYGVDFNQWHNVFYDKNELLWAEIREGHITKQQLRDRRFSEPFQLLGVNDSDLSKKFEENYLIRMGKMNLEVPGAKDLLEYLSPNYTLHIITNGFEEVSKDKLVNANLWDFIETLTCADEIEIRKPDPRIFELAAKKSNAEKSNSVIIGDDWIADILGGTAFGWKAIYFNALKDNNQLDGVPIVESLSEIKSIL